MEKLKQLFGLSQKDPASKEKAENKEEKKVHDKNKSIEDIITDYGYPLEKYDVTTEDGYILGLWRIPYGKDTHSKENRPVILFQHGGFDSSDALFVHGPEKSPAFYLANLGYDVWVGNARGDKHSRKHTSLNPDKDGEFWDWSFPDRIEDDRANIKFILDKTSKEKLVFIGHSEGFTTMLCSLTTTEAAWFKERISFIIGLAPISRLDNMKSKLLRTLGSNNMAINLVKLMGKKEWFGEIFMTKLQFQKLGKTFPQPIEFNLSLNTDGDPSVNNRECFKTYMAHFPGGLSVKLLEHELQMYRAKKFQNFDFGAEENKEKYGTETPPEFELGNITGIPIAMLVGETDLLGDVTDNEWLKNQLGSNVVSYKTYEYGCSSFYIAKDMSYLDDVKDLLNQYRSEKIEITS